MSKTKKSKKSKATNSTPTTAESLARLLSSANAYRVQWGTFELDSSALEPQQADDVATIIYGLGEASLHELRAKLSRWESPVLDFAEWHDGLTRTWVLVTGPIDIGKVEAWLETAAEAEYEAEKLRAIKKAV